MSGHTVVTLFLVACALMPSPARAQIRVDPTIHVSGDAPTRAHTEYFAAVDPEQPDRMLICSMAIDPTHNRLTSIVYRTETAGQSWHLVFDDTVSRFGEAWDPTCAFGPDGTAYMADLSFPPLQAADVPRSVTTLHRSGNVGAHWSGPQALPLLHNPYLTIDQNSRAYAGRIYIVGIRDLPDSNGRGATAPSAMYSTDSGVSFRGPVDLIDTANAFAAPGAGVVRDDGILLVPLQVWRHPTSSAGSTGAGAEIPIVAVASLVGGGTGFGPVSVVATIRPCTETGSVTPVLAIDRSNGRFRGRVYATYNDRSAGRCQVFLAHSDNGGASWSPPTLVDDPRIPMDTGRGPDTFMPEVAVNSVGIVGLTWYDRREDPLNRRFQLRFAASADGGVSMMPSVPVSSTDSLYSDNERYFGVADPWGGGQRGSRKRTDSITVTMNTGGPYRMYYFTGDYGAIATTPDGRFHAIWIDSRTGVPQLYTAPITVAVAAAADSLTNVSSTVEATILNSTYDNASHNVRMLLQLRNTSERELALPLVVQLRSLTSHLGTPRLVGGTDNQIVISSAPGERGSLRPGEVLAPMELKFAFDSFVPLRGQRPAGTPIATLVRFTMIVRGRYR